MNNESKDENLLLLKGIKRWVIAGAIGFLFTGSGVLLVAGTIVFGSMQLLNDQLNIADCGNKVSQYDYDDVNNLIDQGKLDEALPLVEERIQSHPNDASAHWQKARAYYLKKDWKAALAEIDKTEAVSPGYEAELTTPMRKKIEKVLSGTQN